MKASNQANERFSAPTDDLTAIKGIGPVLQKKLNEHGIHRFSQIAALSDKDIEGLEQTIIRFSGRISRENWIGQARRFTEETRPQ